MLTPEKLAEVLFEELERDSWGDIEPFLFRMIAEGIDRDDDQRDEANALKLVLKRACKRPNPSEDEDDG